MCSLPTAALPAPTPDLDCPYASGDTGRDLKKFSYTWDNTNLYMFVRRFASSSNSTNWWFYLDTDNDGLMESGEPALEVSWSGSNGNTNRMLYTYSAARSGGDPLVCPATGANSVADGWCPVAGTADGYRMPGSITGGTGIGSTYAGGATSASGNDADGGSLAGLVMETSIPWNTIKPGASGPVPLGFHISSSNSTNLPSQIVDNMNGPGGGSGGGSIAFTDLAINKMVNPATLSGGDTFSYTLQVTNDGPSNATNIEVTDSLPSGTTYLSDDHATTGTTTSFATPTLTWNIPSLAASSTVSLVISMRSNAVTSSTVISNTATITDHVENDPVTTNDSDTITITVLPAPNLQISKTHTGDFTVGQNGSYTLTVGNIGLGDGVGLVTVSDTLPTGLTYVSATGTGWTCGAAGQVVTCTNPGPVAAGGSLSSITLVVAVGSGAASSVINSATVDGAYFDLDSSNNTSSDPTTVAASPSLTVVKYATGPLGTTITTASPGSTFTYSVVVTNSGSGAATSVVLTDHLSPYTALGINTYGTDIPFSFVDGTPPTGLTLGSPEYSTTGGPPYGGYTPAPIAGFDGNITNWQIQMNDSMAPGSSFTLNYQVKVK